LKLLPQYLKFAFMHIGLGADLWKSTEGTRPRSRRHRCRWGEIYWRGLPLPSRLGSGSVVSSRVESETKQAAHVFLDTKMREVGNYWSSACVAGRAPGPKYWVVEPLENHKVGDYVHALI